MELICSLEKKQKKTKMGTATCVDIILAILLPPLGVFFKYECKFQLVGIDGLCGDDGDDDDDDGVVLQAEFWICLVLTILGYIPGILYALYVLTK
ncbi:hypothetical protein RHGRI_032011 [Rhododendron griersonianum]|uniref:Uncharacterized protein n=1 Tax=Rhododendron griersonianum TaxID=479676 RepID=A0AAV6IA33_9ERIC|nr:hypothetical protein RHGRI_032011 [Rhododendron griersonianum]